MTGIFTYRNFSLSETPPLDGKVAVVTVRSSEGILYPIKTCIEANITISRAVQQASVEASRSPHSSSV